METKTIIVVVLVLLLIVVAVQAYQISNVKEKLTSGSITATASPQGGSVAAPASSSAPASSGMVGGC